ncbi:acyltransferase [Henriciella sp.]|uniref:acyltransferase family protein n=1 Tax=Henriciella sp. TaxID=1968823 RepID=UPI002602C655|nr:acyltransferase [Henriciella sp.]
MSRGFSLYLDLVRFAAAVVVLFSHIAYERYSAGALAWVRDLNIGSDAVILFFVLSGFVIAYTTFGKKRGAADFTKARVARLYSVVIPAVLLAIFLDTAGQALNPERYEGWWYQPLPVSEHFFRALSFSTQLWSDNIRLGTNGPFWSLTYEAWYYLAFGVAVYSRGHARWLILALLALITGPKIILLAPCWLAGVGLEYGIRKGHLRNLSRPGAIFMAVAPWLVYSFCLFCGLPETLRAITADMLGANPTRVLGFSDEVFWNSLIAVLASLHFLGVYNLAGNGDRISPKMEKVIRWTAGATFSVYLFHYPLLTFFYSFPVYEPANSLHVIILGLVTLISCFILAEVSERRLSSWRSMMDRIAETGRKQHVRQRSVS